MQLHEWDEQLILASMLVVPNAITRVLASGMRSTSYGSTKNKTLQLLPGIQDSVNNVCR